MVFQPTNILNPRRSHRFAVKRAGLILRVSVFLVLASLSSFSAVFAEFPGKGENAKWSEALPHYNLANKYMTSARYDDAIKKYRDAIALYEFDPDFYINLGVALRKVDNLTDAEAAYKKAAELNDKDWMTWSNLANVYLKQDKLEETIKAFERSMKCNPPPLEKTSIQRDIADIRKILNVRNGTIQPPASKNAPAAKIIFGSKTAGNKNKSNAAPARASKSALQNNAVKPSQAGFPARSPREDLNGTGWDEVYK